MPDINWGERVKFTIDTYEINKWDRVVEDDENLKKRNGTVVSIHDEHSITISYAWDKRIKGWLIRIFHAVIEL